MFCPHYASSATTERPNAPKCELGDRRFHCCECQQKLASSPALLAPRRSIPWEQFAQLRGTTAAA